MTSHRPPPALLRVVPARWRDHIGHLSLMALAVLLVWAGVAVHLREVFEQARQEAVGDTRNFARAYEENIARTFDAIDQTLLFVRELYMRDPAHFDLTTWARNRHFIRGITFQISLVDAAGIVVASNLGPVISRVDLSDREHIRAQKDSAEDVLFVSVPVVGRVSGKLSLNVSRKLLDANGGYAGAVVVSVDPFDLSRLQETLSLGNGIVLLVGDDRIVRARAPAYPAALGRQLDDAAVAHMFTGLSSGTFESRSPIDGIARLVSFRHVPDYPLSVAVALALDDVFAGYRAERAEYLVAGGIVTLLVLGVGWMLIRQRGRLVRSQTALTVTLENISQGILMADADGRVAVLNRRAVALLGLPADLVRPNLTLRQVLLWQIQAGEFGPPDSVDPANLRFAEAAEPTGEATASERVRPNGMVLEVRGQLLPEGGVVRTFADVTERRGSEQALAAARDAAEAAMRVRSEFLAVMSHEIRTPMNGILGVAGLLMDMSLAEMERAYVRIILDSGNHLLQLINDILDFSRLDAGRLGLEAGTFDLHDIVAATVALLLSEARSKGFDITLDIAPEVPHRLGGDARRLRQVLLNLIGNAVKFTERGGVRVAVTRLADEPDSVHLEFCIADTGIGIPADALGTLFTEFTQVDSSISRRFGGSGLGLAISRQLVALMGGAIAAESTPGKGSVFRFDVRLRPRDDAAEAAADLAALAALPGPERAACATAGAPSAGRLRVLVAEDNATNRLVATRMLERLGHRVDAVDNGRAAVAAVAVAAQPYDLVLMDVMMPEMDGLTATTEIRALPGPAGRTPILGLTANALRADAAACLAAGMDHFATKPISAPGLEQAINEVMARARTVDAAAPGPATEAALPDRGTLTGLVRDLGHAPAVELVRLFVETAPRQLATLRTLASRQEYGDLIRQAHTLANAARSLGLAQVARGCRDLEEEAAVAAEAMPAGTGRLAALDRLETLLDQGVAALQAWSPATAETP